MLESIQQFFTTSPVDPRSVSQSLWLIIALPLLGAAVCGFFGRLLGRANVNLIACASVGGSFLLSALAFWALNDPRTSFAGAYEITRVPYALGHDYGTWFSAGDFTVSFGLFLDHLSGTLLMVITGVGFLIHLYSTGYMSHDEGYWRYFAYLNLFVAMMLTLVMADNLVLLFVGWEGVGLCSYLLIGFWYTDSAKAWAGRKAFVANRVGDFAFVLATMLMVLLIGAFGRQAGDTNLSRLERMRWEQGVDNRGPLNFRSLEVMARGLPSEVPSGTPAAQAGSSIALESEISEGPLSGFSFGGVLTVAMLLFLLGAAGKSAQLPLFVWLPDAMAGPTPVSALIHAATMVTAGVYLFCRMSALLVASPLAMAVVAIVGALTALLAALIAFAQDDIKKVLAYSTVSQLGFMFMGVGLGIFWAAVLHLVTHAFFKACLFLGAGSVMHGNDDETDIKRLGGLRREMKWTWATFLIATLAITGIVPLSGFFSKDAILHGIHGTTLVAYPWVNTAVWLIGLTAALCTAFYMTRLYVLTFEGKRSAEARIPHAHESAPAMTIPLVVLAFLSVVALVYGLPVITDAQGHSQTLMQNYLLPVFHNTGRIFEASPAFDVHHSSPVGAWIIAWIIAIVGGGAAVVLYLKVFPSRGDRPAPAFARTANRWARDKFYVDELYELIVLRPIKAVASLLYRVVDTLLIDTVAVRGTAWVTQRAGSALRYLQTGDAQSYATVMALALVGGLVWVFFTL